jgi:multicomponent Na+:H+ antiporter subunit B
VLYSLIYGLANSLRVLPPNVPYMCGALGVMIYAGVGFVTIALGGNFLAYNVLAHDPEHGQHYGILLIEMGVLVTVFGVMVGLFYAFAGRGRTG